MTAFLGLLIRDGVPFDRGGVADSLCWASCAAAFTRAGVQHRDPASSLTPPHTPLSHGVNDTSWGTAA